MAIVEHDFDVGTLVPPHVHCLGDEYFIVLVGSIGFRSGDQEVVLQPRALGRSPSPRWSRTAGECRRTNRVVNHGRGDELAAVQREDGGADILVDAVFSLPHRNAEAAELGSPFVVEDVATEDEAVPAAVALVAQIERGLLGVVREEAESGAGGGAAQASGRRPL